LHQTQGEFQLFPDTALILLLLWDYAISNRTKSHRIAVLTIRVQSEAAYTALEQVELTIEQIDILGKEYQSADKFGLINSNDEAEKQMNQLSTWMMPFGFAAGYLFNLVTSIEIISWSGTIGNHIVGGFFGAAVGTSGAFASGTLSGWTTGSGDAIAYRNRLNAGKYLIIARVLMRLLKRPLNCSGNISQKTCKGMSRSLCIDFVE
jgi:hypothetical protein